MYLQYRYYENLKWLKGIQITMLSGFSVIGGVVAFLLFIGLMGLLFGSSTISDSERYIQMDYQEYLVKNPEYKLNVNNKALTKFMRPELEAPLILNLDVGEGGVYEVFVKETGKQVPVLMNQLYVKAEGT